MNTAKELQLEFTEDQDNIELIRHFLRVPIPKNTWDKLSKEQRRAFMHASEQEVNATLSEGKTLRFYVCATEIAYELFNVDDTNKAKSLIKEINYILANLYGWNKLNVSKRMGVYGIQKNVYERFNPLRQRFKNHRGEV